MALHKQTFRTRAISAVIFAVIMIAGLMVHPLAFLVLFSVIHFGCWWEFILLIEKIHRTGFHIYIKMGLMAMGYGLMIWFWPLPVFGYNPGQSLSLPLSSAGFALVIIGIFQKGAVKSKGLLALLGGLVYISLSWGFFLSLYGYLFTRGTYEFRAGLFLSWVGLIPVVIVVIIWINDTMAYIVGSFIGKTPLSTISPKKTWEGTVGGIILAVTAGYLLIHFLLPYSDVLDWYHWVIISVIIAVAGTFGDLLESKLKRMAGVKDSGTMMPGHGGFLDRFDSMLLAIPCVWIYLQVFAQLNS